MNLLTDVPENHGIRSDIIADFIEELELLDLQVTSLVLLRNGKSIAQFCKKPYDKNCLQLLFSLSKSFTGIGAGIACDMGLITLDDQVISFFSDMLPPVLSENLQGMQVKHLLTMSCGIHENTYGQLYPQKDWVKAFLAQDFPHKPGMFYRYSTHATYMLSAIMEKVAGVSFYAFLKKHLLEPMEIHDSSWEACGQGITAGGMGLGLTTQSMAKFGQMLLDKGVYRDRRIVSEEYVKLAISQQIEKGRQEKVSRSQGYGFQIHIDREAGCYFGDGAFGQLCYV